MVTAAIGTAVSLGLSALSGALTPTQNVFNETEVGKLDNISTRKTGAGWTLGKVYGRVQINGCPIFWAPERREEVVTTTESTRSGGSKFGGGTTTTNQTNTYKYYGTFAFAICDGGAGIDVRQIKFNDKIWYNKDGQLNGTIADNDYKLENYLKIYSGASNQSIDPTIQNYEGNQNGDRNFRHLVYCVVTDFPLDEFGGELPTGIDVVVLRDDTTGDQPYNRIDKVIYEAAETVGLVPGVDVKCDGLLNSVTNGARDLRINGVFKQDGTSAADFINEIVQRYFLMSYLDDDGAIIFDLPENFDDQVVKYWANLGVVEYGNDPGDPYSEIMPDESELPSSVTLNYQNINDDFNSDNEIKLYTIAEHYNPKSVNSSLYLVPDEAKWWVWKYLQLAWQQARRFTINLLPEDTVQLTEGFKLLIPLTDNGTAITFTIASIVVGSNLTSEIELYSFEGNIFTADPDIDINTNVVYNGGTIQLNGNIKFNPIVTNAGGTITYVEGVDYSVNTTTGELVVLGGSSIQPGDGLNISYTAEPDFTVDSYNPDLESADYGEPTITVVETNRIRLNDTPCIYAAIGRGNADFGATVIYLRVDGASYQPVGSVLTPTAVGTLSNELPLQLGLDTTSVITVVMSEGKLEQLTQNQFDAQEIVLLVGDEQIIARDVTLVDSNTYQLSYLQRGINGTPVVAHSASETVYIAKGTIDALSSLAIDTLLIGKTVDLKAVPNNVTLTDIVSVTTHTIQGIYYKPYAGNNGAAISDQGGNIYLGWTSLDTGNGLLSPQSFEVDILNNGSVVRTLTNSSNDVVYEAASQVADFGSIQSTITVDIYQISPIVGRGYVYSDVITPTPTVYLAEIKDFSPRQGDVGDLITLYGFRFTNATESAIGGINIDNFTVVDDFTITGNIGLNTTSGKVTVTNSAGIASSLFDFGVVNFGLGQVGSLRYTNVLNDITIPDVGGTVTVEVEKPDMFGPQVPVMILDPSNVGGEGFAQLFCTAAPSGNTITLKREPYGLVTKTSFFTGTTIISTIIERITGIFGGVLNADWNATEGYQQILNLPCLFSPLPHSHNHSHTVSVRNPDATYSTYTTSEDSTANEVVDCGSGGSPGGGGDISLDLSGYMLKSTYDNDNDGIVDRAFTAGHIEGYDLAGNSQYYGTDNTGTAGFHALPLPVWGSITGSLTSQTDLQLVLDGKMAIATYDSNSDGVVDSADKVEGIDAAGNSKYYGTDKTGTAGFYDFPVSESGQIQVTIYDGGEANTVTFEETLDGGNAGTTTFDNVIDAGDSPLYLSWGDIAGTLSDQTDLQAALDSKIESIPFGGFIETIADKTYPLFKPDRSYMLKSLRVKSDSGTCTWAVQIGGVDVTGLSAVSVSSVEQLVSATGANTINAGDRVTIVSTNNSSAVDVEFTIMLEAI